MFSTCIGEDVFGIETIIRIDIVIDLSHSFFPFAVSSEAVRASFLALASRT